MRNENILQTETTGKTLVTAIMLAMTMIGLVVVIGLVIYTLGNDSGHTGFDPYLVLFAFVPLAVIGLLHFLFIGRKQGPKWLGVLAIAVGILGIVLTIYLVESSTLLEYNEWIRRGMP